MNNQKERLIKELIETREIITTAEKLNDAIGFEFYNGDMEKYQNQKIKVSIEPDDEDVYTFFVSSADNEGVEPYEAVGLFSTFPNTNSEWQNFVTKFVEELGSVDVPYSLALSLYRERFGEDAELDKLWDTGHWKLFVRGGNLIMQGLNDIDGYSETEEVNLTK